MSVTEVCLFRSFPVKDSVLLTGDEFIIYITFRNMGGLPIRSRGRERKCSLSWNHLPVASGLASDSWAQCRAQSPVHSRRSVNEELKAGGGVSFGWREN